MKRVLLITISLIIVTIVNAQTEQGNIIVGSTFGGLNFGSQKQTSSSIKSFNLTLNPLAAWFVADNIAVGAQLNLGYRSEKITSQTTSTTSYGISPLVRYYFVGEGTTQFFGQGKFNFGGLKQKDLSSTSYIGFGLGAGLDHFVSDNVAIEAALGYDYLKPKNAKALNNLSINFGLQIFLGKGELKEKIQSIK
jgi:opacity protein-like surface antigen